MENLVIKEMRSWKQFLQYITWQEVKLSEQRLIGNNLITIHGVCPSSRTDMKGPLRFLISCILEWFREFGSMNLNCKSLHTMPWYQSSNLWVLTATISRLSLVPTRGNCLSNPLDEAIDFIPFQYFFLTKIPKNISGSWLKTLWYNTIYWSKNTVWV